MHDITMSTQNLDEHAASGSQEHMETHDEADHDIEEAQIVEDPSLHVEEVFTTEMDAVVCLVQVIDLNHVLFPKVVDMGDNVHNLPIYCIFVPMMVYALIIDFGMRIENCEILVTLQKGGHHLLKNVGYY